jgi:Phosphate-selective porin O and P
MFAKALWVFTLALFWLTAANAQSDVPILSGGAGFLGANQGGNTFLQPVVAPVLVVPLGDNWLIESRADLRGFVSREDGTTGPFQGQFFGTLEYLQVDYKASSRLTVTAGRFLTPFGIFNERLSAIWINKFQDAPVIAAIGTAAGYSDGLMLRGALISNSHYAVNYTAYFSTLSTIGHLESERTSGGRVGVFFPGTRLEVGTSYQRKLQDQRMNSYGMDVSWAPYSLPLEIKGEWAHSLSGHGYWIQGGYRLSQLGGGESVIGRLEPVIRMQQFFRSQEIAGDSLPSTNVRLPEFGLNYYLPHEVRLNASYGRESISHATDVNVWQFGITYRFLFPLWPGESK